ncbi:MAG TPA: STAS domain-containing protein [Solirubrobacterales bacterium]
MFELSERDLEAGCLEIRVSGELDLAVAPELRAALEEATDVESVVLSMEECEFIDSTAIAVIVREQLRRQENDKKFAVAGCTKQVHRILDVTGLTGNGLVFASVEDALASWR